MTEIIIIGVIMFLIGGIMWLNTGSPSKKKSREDLLKDLTRVLEGKLESLEGFENSYRITFTFEGYDFRYEDVESMGFKDKIYKSYLKIDTDTKLTLIFGEKQRTKLIEHAKSHSHGIVRLPKTFSDFGATSNNASLSQAFLDDAKVVKIFKRFAGFDPWGKPRMMLRISEGVIVLTFDSEAGGLHKPLRYVTETSIIEEYLDQLIVLVKRLESL